MIQTSSFSGSNLEQSMMRKKRGGGRNRRKKRTRRRRGRGRDGNPPAHVGPYVRADDSSLMNKGAYLARLQLAARLALERRVARDAQLAKNEKYMNELLEFSDDEHKKGGNRRKKRTRRRRGRGISQSKPREEKEDARAAAHLRRLDEIQEELDFKIACMKRFMNSASTNDIDKVQRLQERNFVKAAYAAMIKWCKENPTNPMNIGGRRTRKKRGKGPQQRAVAGKFVGNILSKYKPKAKPKARRKKSHTAKKADHAPRAPPQRPVYPDIVEVQDSILSVSPTFEQVSNEYYGGDHGPKWFLARVTGGDVGAGGGHFYFLGRRGYQIQLLNAAGEDAGQGLQYVAQVRAQDGRTYTWRGPAN